jgi:predicted metal-dependent phosphotriesterase family hydrolase
MRSLNRPRSIRSAPSARSGHGTISHRMSARYFGLLAVHTLRQTFRSSRTPAFLESRPSNNLTILEDVGVDPKHVVIGHLGNLVDPTTEVHRAICRRGAFVGFDRQGGPNDEQVVPIVMSLIDAGYADHLMFSSDFSNANALKRNNKELGYAKTLTVFVPKVKKAGASDEVLRQIMNDNPRRFLAFIPKVKRKA